MRHSYGFVRIAAAVPRVRVADPARNATELSRLAGEAAIHGVQLIVFPELCLTGYTCGDLFKQKSLLDAAEDALAEFVKTTYNLPLISVVGMPLHLDGQRFNVAAVVNSGQIVAVIPKQYIPNYREFYELRWFSRADWTRREEVMISGTRVPFGNNLLVEAAGIPYFRFAVEICEDLWEPTPPSSHQALAGARILVNLSASNAVVAKADYRRSLVQNQSARCVAAYLYTSCGVGESSGDLVFDGHAIVAENGITLAESERYARESQLVITDVDLEKLVHERMDSSFGQAVSDEPEHAYRTVTAQKVRPMDAGANQRRMIDSHPFVPNDPVMRDTRCAEVWNLIVSGLATRLEHLERATGKREVSIGISGGLDSTLALLVTVKTFDLLAWDRRGIIAVTMPGFGTTDRTKGNAEKLCEALGVTLREIPIRDATLQHLRDIGHEADLRCTVCQNAQARNRTMILMNLGFVVGTGDLSEIALGWCTYNGDHMSMYNVNCGVPKTLVRYVVGWVSETGEVGAREVLRDILATPISPELEPPDAEGKIAQKTEDIIGPYGLHDFFLFHMIRNGFVPRKIAFLAERAFAGIYGRAAILRWLREFYVRFFSAQFKRDAAPDGPKVGSVSLSQRGDWRMPADASGDLWIAEVDALIREAG